MSRGMSWVGRQVTRTLSRPILLLALRMTASSLAAFALAMAFSLPQGYWAVLTAVIVTHDVPEALAASDRVALLEEGRIHFEGTPSQFAASDDCIVRSFGDNIVTLRTGLGS